MVNSRQISINIIDSHFGDLTEKEETKAINVSFQNETNNKV